MFFIILIIEARFLSGIFLNPPTGQVNQYGPSVLAIPDTGTITTSVTGGRAATESQSPNPGITLQDLTLTNSLTVLGNTLSGKTSIAGGLTIDGSLSLDAQGIQNLSGTLYLQKNTLAPIDVMNGALRVNTNGLIDITGNMHVRGILGAETISPIDNTLTVDLTSVGSGSAGFGSLLVKGSGGAYTSFDSSGSAYFSGNIEASGTGTFTRISSPLMETSKLLFIQSEQSKSIGLGTIPAGYSAMKILTNSVTPDSRVFVTPVSVSVLPISVTQINPPSPAQGGSFTVETSAPVPRDLDFNWFLVN